MTKIRAKDIDAGCWNEEGPGEEVGNGCLFPPEGREKAELALSPGTVMMGRRSIKRLLWHHG